MRGRAAWGPSEDEAVFLFGFLFVFVFCVLLFVLFSFLICFCFFDVFHRLGVPWVWRSTEASIRRCTAGPCGGRRRPRLGVVGARAA